MFENLIKAVAPSSVEELKAMFPEMAKELCAQGAKDVDVTQAVSEGKKEVLSLVSAQFGDEAGEKFAALVASGVTAEQIKALKALNPERPAVSAEATLMAEMLKEIKKAGSDNPGVETEDNNSDAGLSVEEKAKKNYATKPDIREKFGSEARYVSFCTAVKAGRIKILGQKK